MKDGLGPELGAVLRGEVTEADMEAAFGREPAPPPQRPAPRPIYRRTTTMVAALALSDLGEPAPRMPERRPPPAPPRPQTPEEAATWRAAHQKHLEELDRREEARREAEAKKHAELSAMRERAFAKHRVDHDQKRARRAERARLQREGLERPRGAS